MARANHVVVCDGGGVGRTEQIAGVGVAGGSLKRAGGREAGGFVVDKGEGGTGPVGRTGIVVLKNLVIPAKRQDMGLLDPLDAVLNYVSVLYLIERAGAGPATRSVGAGKGDSREAFGGLPGAG